MCRVTEQASPQRYIMHLPILSENISKQRLRDYIRLHVRIIPLTWLVEVKLLPSDCFLLTEHHYVS